MDFGQFAKSLADLLCQAYPYYKGQHSDLVNMLHGTDKGLQFLVRLFPSLHSDVIGKLADDVELQEDLLWQLQKFLVDGDYRTSVIGNQSKDQPLVKIAIDQMAPTKSKPTPRN